MFLNGPLISGGTEERRQNRKIVFRTPFFLTENHLQKDQIFEKYGINTQRGTQEWQTKLKFKKSSFSENLFHEKLFERQSYKWGYRKPMIQRKIYNLVKKFSSLKLNFAKKIRLVLYDSSMGLHTNRDQKIHLGKNCFFGKLKYILEEIVFFW